MILNFRMSSCTMAYAKFVISDLQNKYKSKRITIRSMIMFIIKKCQMQF